ncbi:MAG TPA: S1 RNA-binding domain-containing protein [Candidatus Bathyarchaeia archaeon]|nr:S1 RNA-binding domain-containing protein [Candidatus Bathyarchaeia archaeon]
MDRDDQRRRNGQGEESFPELLEGTMPESVRLEPGEKVTARIIGITSEYIFLDLGWKGEGYLERKEFLDSDGNLTVREGDTVRTYFLGTKNNEMWFATKIGGEAVGESRMEDALRNGIPVEGNVDREVKGGYSVRIAGGLRGFCPFSQAGFAGEESRGKMIGKKLLFRITKYDKKGRNIVLSHRAVLEEKRREERESLKGRLREGMTVRGRVTSVREFGAFVSAGPIEGLVPASEVGWERGGDIRDTLTVGQEVEVAVMHLDWDKERFTFSMKKTLADPWEGIEKKYPEGSLHTGKVSRRVPFGIFVSMEPGVDGLLHISKLGEGKRTRNMGEFGKEGETIPVKVDRVDKKKRKISLSLPEDENEEGRMADSEDYRQYFIREKSPSLDSLGEALKEKLEEKKNK